jgi:O-antigen/teichoic acid export membrane protein
MLKSFLGDTFVYGAARLLAPIGSVLLLPVYTSFLNPAEFGIVALFEVGATILTNVMLLGIDQIIPRHFLGEEAAELDSYISAGLYLCLASAATFLCTTIVLVLPLLNSLLQGHAISAYRGLLPFLAAQSAAAVPVYFAVVILRMKRRVFATNLVTLGLFVLRSAVSLVLLVGTDFRVEALVLGNVAATAGMAICCLYLLRYCLANAPRMKQLREVAYQAFFMWTNVLVATAGQTADRISLGALVPAGELGKYSVSHKISSSLQFAGATWLYVFQPYLFRRRAGENPQLKHLIGMTAAFLAVIAIGVMALRYHIIAFLAHGNEYAEAATYIPLLLLAFWLKYVWSFLSQELVKANRTPLVPVISSVGTVCLVLSLLLLVPAVGVLGAAIGLVIYRSVNITLAYVAVRGYDSDIPWRMLIPCGVLLGLVSWTSSTGTAELAVQGMGLAISICLLVHQVSSMLVRADMSSLRRKAAFWRLFS